MVDKDNKKKSDEVLKKANKTVSSSVEEEKTEKKALKEKITNKDISTLNKEKSEKKVLEKDSTSKKTKNNVGEKNKSSEVLVDSKKQSNTKDSELSKEKEVAKGKEVLTAKNKDTKLEKPKSFQSVEKKRTLDTDDNNEAGDYIEKLVSINRVAKVVKGGGRFSFAALVVVGDGNGMVGHGKGKAKEVPGAIKKATEEAKNKLIRVPLRQGRTLHHDIHGRYDSGKVFLRSAPSGTGVIAGGPMRAVFEALGIQDIVAKSVGTSNPHNMVRATFEALKLASSPKIIAIRRGLKINEITKRRKSDQDNTDAKN